MMNTQPASAPRALLSRTYAPGRVDTDIPRWNLQCVQTSSGTLDGGARELHTDGVQILEEHYRHVMTNHYGVAPPNAIGFVIPRRTQCDGMFDGHAWSAADVCVWNTNREFNAIAPPSDILCVIVDRGLLVEHIALTEQLDLESALLRVNMVIHAPESSLLLAHRLGQLVKAGFSGQWDTSTQAAQEAIQQEVLESISPLVVEQLDGGRSHQGRFSHLVNVRRARDVALSHSDTPLQIQDLCRTLQISRRTLQESFRAILRIGPLSYLRALRLDGARRDLMTGRSVKEVAETWGFWHWSRFSQDYRRLFNELPSTTVRRTLDRQATDARTVQPNRRNTSDHSLPCLSPGP